MEIRVLRYFLETAREGNITRAAERLHVTQPTMSRQLKDMEEELGVKLFIRTNYALRLTEAGMLLRNSEWKGQATWAQALAVPWENTRARSGP